ncbi:MAG TPA: Cmx/CmrA family chloramphenicol efflux MFS transporter [Jiangellaceae bacterium]|nr:Cmx/CmrA family chloramphenicol efflux MFS transporter [Jiangellaceae bacterium]
MAVSAAPTTRVPAAVFVLGASIFCLGTTEFMIAGLLPTIAADLGVSIPSAGLLISGFAIGMAVGTPLMTAATLRLPRRATLLVSLLVFVSGHVLAALAPTYGVLMTARVLTAVACGTFWAGAAVVSVALAPAGARAKALAVLLGGLTVSNVVGVPLGALVGQQLGWRAAFWAIAGLALVSAVGVALVVPRRHSAAPRAVLRHELRTFASSRVWVALATIAVFQTAVFAVFSYVAPLLTDHAGWPASRVPMVLALFGLGSLVGIVVGGKFADRNLFLNLYAGLATLSLVLAALALVARSGLAATAAIVAMAVTAFSVAPAINARVFVVAGEAPTLASSATTSAFNVGNTVGPWIGGTVIGAGLGYTAPAWLGAGLALVALGMAVLAGTREKRARKEAEIFVPCPTLT